jgi:nicotinamide-nucleotide amidase
MHEMMQRAILPDLVRRSGRTAVIRSRVLRTWGESESGLNERLAGIIDELDSRPDPSAPTLAFLASGWEGIKVRLTAAGESDNQANEILDNWEVRIREVVGDLVFGVDTDTMESVVLDMLAAGGDTLAVAESVTGGLVTGRLTNIPGASRVLRGGVVSYASDVKSSVLGVPEGPVVTREAAIAMATGVKRALSASVGLSLTGVAGPDEQEGQPVGTLWVGIALSDGSADAVQFRLPATRDQMRQMSVISALSALRQRYAMSRNAL